MQNEEQRAGDGDGEDQWLREKARRSSILLAEDHEPLRDLLATILRLEGYEVTPVSSADQMQRELDRSNDSIAFDVIVTDMRMPGGSGLDVVSTLRASGSRIPVILMTAFPDDAVRERAASLGTIVVGKPFALDTICLALEWMLEGRRQESTWT